ncbi:dipeptidase [soil metagenome]
MPSQHPAPNPLPLFDLHCDVLLRAHDNGVDLKDAPSWVQASLPNLRAGGVTEQVFAVWVDTRELRGDAATHRALRVIDIFEEQVRLHADDFALATTTAEAARIVASDRLAVYLWLEGGEAIADDLAMLRIFHKLGVRGMTITWCDNINWAGSSTDKDNPHQGLSDFGREVIHEMNRLGMIVDLSHVSDETFWDVMKEASAPVIVSHSGCRSCCDHARNVDDDMLRAVAKNGGIIGVCIVPEYLHGGWQSGWESSEESQAEELNVLKSLHSDHKNDPVFRDGRRRILQKGLPTECVVSSETVLDHIDHAIKVAGPKHVALGSDFDGIWAFPSDLESPANWPVMIDGMRRRGHSEEVIRGVLADNARRVFREVLG